MYFNRRVLATVAILSNYGIAEAGTCPQSVVNAASDAEFLKFALLNCIPTTVPAVGQAGTNSLGKTTLDPQTCLATFVANSKVSFGTAACLDTYTQLIRDILAKINAAGPPANTSPFVAPTGTGAGAYDACRYDATNDQILVSYVCWNRLAPMLTAFQQKAGYPVVTNACEGSFVRSQALLKSLQNVVTNTLKAVANGTAASYSTVDYNVAAAVPDGTNHIVVGRWAKNAAGDYKANGVDLNLAMCYGAYQTIFDYLQGSTLNTITDPPLAATFGTTAGGPSGWLSGGLAMTALQTACQSDITSAACSASQLMSGLKLLFNNMSGYDIGFTGPLCSADIISKLNSSSLTPIPYRFFVVCGLMSSKYPDLCSATSVAQYVTKLDTAVGTECSGCYNEMYSLIQKYVSNSTVTSACNSPDNVTSDSCVAAMANVTAGFKSCSGSDLYTKVPSTTSSPTNGTGSNNTNHGNSPNGASSQAAINSGIIVLIAVLTYLM